MNEWNVVEVIVVLIGLLITVGSPIIKLTNSMNALSGQVTLLLKNLDEFKSRYRENLNDLNKTDTDLYNKYEDHEQRITRLETEVRFKDGDK